MRVDNVGAFLCPKILCVTYKYVEENTGGKIKENNDNYVMTKIVTGNLRGKNSGIIF